MTERSPRGLVRALIGVAYAAGACFAQGSTSSLDGGALEGIRGHDGADSFQLGDVLTASPDAGNGPRDSATSEAANTYADGTIEDSGRDSTSAVDAGAPVDAGSAPCVPTTCTEQGISCGGIPDGCGSTLACGVCASPETCGGGSTPNACGCTPRTCASAHATCGSVSDGCGATLACGSCTVPETCGGSGTANACGAPCGVMAPGGELAPGQHLASCDGRFSLDMQSTDGNLVLYFGSDALWQAKTSGNPGAHASMQTDGNFVVYSAASTALWQAKTSGNAGAYLVMQTDGNLVVYSPSGSPLWSSGTCCH